MILSLIKRGLAGGFLLCCLVPNLGISRDYLSNRVVLVIIDGLRYSEGLGDASHELTPRMAALAEQGALIEDFRNDGFTYTSRAVPAIWCGAWTTMNAFSDSTCNGTANSYASLPSLFEYYRRNLDRPETDCVYTLKDLCSWKGSFHPDYGPQFWPLYHTAGQSDEDVWHETEQVIAQQAPHLLLMYLADVDHEGHSGNWDAYTRAISIADSLVGVLWETLQNDPLYADQTTLLVTNDHGRHTTDFSGHGDDCEGCRHIQLLAAGPDVHVGLLSQTSRTIPDITPTIGALLGFDTEYASGSPMLELFQQTARVQQPITSHPQFLALIPNPANAGTRIHFSLEMDTDLRLIIYNLNGRPLRHLGGGAFPAGTHDLFWDGTDDLGAEMSSGVYLFQLRSSNHSDTRKLVVLR